MASIYGREGNLPIELAKLTHYESDSSEDLEDWDLSSDDDEDDDDDEAAYDTQDTSNTTTRNGASNFSPSAAATRSQLTSTHFTPRSPAAQMNVEGCRMCGRDDDHQKLLICEGCHGEFHMYCLQPPLSRVPAGDWFCDVCQGKSRPPIIVESETALVDDLNQMVSTLGPEFQRFGEICWADGGAGFGWWPACIYDPRWTTGSVRNLAKKNMRKKHLVYFFECRDAPFTALTSKQIVDWEIGLIYGFDQGKTAKAANRTRSICFGIAFQIAMMEYGKPVYMRLDWNHGNNEASSPPTTRSRATRVEASRQNHSETRRSRRSSQPRRVRSDFLVDLPNFSMSATNDDSSHMKSYLIKSRRTNKLKKRLMRKSKRGRAEKPEEEEELYCKVFLKEASLHQLPSFVKAVTLPSKESATFHDIRAKVQDLSDNLLDEVPVNWRFYVPNLGPLSIKQEGKIEAFDLLTNTGFESKLGKGTPLRPLRIIIQKK